MYIMEFELVPLHQNWHHKDACTVLLNAEWPRSVAAREHSLNKSCDRLPCCLVFRHAGTKEVVGYSQIVAVQGKKQACLFESVIIRQDLRGTGLGRKLMDSTEQFAKQLGFQTVYLSTHDKQGFYARLGYSECGPVISLGDNAGRVSNEFLQKLLGSNAVQSDKPSSSRDKSGNTVESSRTLFSASPEGAAPPAPPPPPPPLLPPVKQESQSNKTLSRHVIRMDPNSVTWMQKSL